MENNVLSRGFNETTIRFRKEKRGHDYSAYRNAESLGEELRLE